MERTVGGRPGRLGVDLAACRRLIIRGASARSCPGVPAAAAEESPVARSEPRLLFAQLALKHRELPVFDFICEDDVYGSCTELREFRKTTGRR
jgi:hypothetical protein